MFGITEQLTICAHMHAEVCSSTVGLSHARWVGKKAGVPHQDGLKVTTFVSTWRSLVMRKKIPTSRFFQHSRYQILREIATNKPALVHDIEPHTTIKLNGHNGG